jgi:hypothetical protein
VTPGVGVLMMKNLETQGKDLKFIIAMPKGKLGIFLGGLEPTGNHKILAEPWFQGQGTGDPVPGGLEAWFAGDDFPGKVVDHGPGAVFADQSR